ncbi:MAG: hypothetical protein RLZZ502_1422 [Pseudomonadota bacterium]|jgi:outer membrane protein OmpA-like peptidoglycan-associated protein
MNERRYDDENPDSIADGEVLYGTHKKSSVLWWLIPLLLGVGALLWFSKDSRWVKPILGIDTVGSKSGEMVSGVVKSEAGAPNPLGTDSNGGSGNSTSVSSAANASPSLGAGKFGEWQLQSTDAGVYTVSGRVPTESARAELLVFLNNQLGVKVQDKLQLEASAATVKVDGLAALLNWLKNFPGIAIANSPAGLEISGDAPSDNMRTEMFRRATELLGANGTLVNKLNVAGQTVNASVAPNFAAASAPASSPSPVSTPTSSSVSPPAAGSAPAGPATPSAPIASVAPAAPAAPAVPTPVPVSAAAPVVPASPAAVPAPAKIESKVETKSTPPKPEPAKDSPAPRKVERIQVLFNMSASEIRPESLSVLKSLAKRLIESKQTGEIAGHTDNRGDAAANLNLSQARANSVRAYLVQQGVPEAQLTAKGYGQTQPLNDNSTVMERQQNRRIEFIAK